MSSVRQTCYYCGNGWGACTCTKPVCAAFAAQDYWVTDPAVSVCGRFFVDPTIEYGSAYTQAQRLWDEYRCEHGCKPNAVCSTCGAPMCDHAHEIYSMQCLACDKEQR